LLFSSANNEYAFVIRSANLSIGRMCELTRVSRASFYRSVHQQQPVEEELEVRSAIQQIAIEHRRRYGYRRISAELRRRGMQVNHKRVMRSYSTLQSTGRRG
jgi:putative transposase